MNPVQLLAHFDRISEAPDAVPRLRQFILDLAVRGKLVEQDPRDEPASELLKRIQAEKVRLAKVVEIRKPQPSSPVSDLDSPFDLPAGWVWSNIGAICSKTGSGSTPRGGKNAYCERGIIFLRSQNIYDDGLNLNDVAYIDAATHARMSGTIVRPSDLLLCITGGSIGRCCRVPDDFGEANVSQHVAIIRVAVDGLQDFLHRLILSPNFQAFIFDEQTGAGRGGLPKNRMDRIPVALPPLAEQHRIVAKVNELMALCDRLEAAQAERENRRDRLVAATHARLADLSPVNSQPSTFFINHLPHLTTRPEHIQQLRETVLQLAVTGKLSEQRPVDGDAQTLLRRLGRKRRKERKSSVVYAAESREPLPPLPETWAWAIIDEVAAGDDNAITDGPFGANLKTAHYVETPGYRVIRLQNIGRGQFRTEHRSYIDKERFERLAKHRVFAGDLVVAGLVDPLVRCCEVPHEIGPALVKADCYRFKVHPNFSSRFALHYLNSPLCQRFAAVHHHGMTLVRIGLGNFRLIPIPVPPLAEQHRIVAKVDELLALCDRLEKQLTTSQTESRYFLEATLRAIKPEANEAWRGSTRRSTAQCAFDTDD